MPQINRIRVNNVKYNFGTQVYDDFVMRFNCQNTIYDLANGGGKSLLMLLLMQNMLPNCTLDDKQPIEKLFRQGSGNTCIHSLVEWKLDPCYQKDGFRFMTTGFCARKGRGTDDENQDGQEQTAAPTASVEYFNYCIFYREFGDNDIKNLPLVSNGERITYNGLKAYLRDLEKGGYKYVVKIFDRKGDYQSFISNYGIYESAWEIVRGINKTEGHVRTYFESNYKTSRKVVEDLLIEEIIQKSFNNKLSVDNDEGMMAQTLMDIKDKLVELSKKHSQLGAYDSQIAAIDSFKEYLSTYEAFYNRKEEIEKQLYDLLLVAMRESDKKDKELKSQDDLITKMYDELAHEKEAIAVAEVMSEKNSMAGVESLVNETRKALELKNAAIEEARGKLSLMESAGDYKDYAEYEKSYKGLQIAIDNRLREDTDITAELKILAAGYRKFYETETRRLKNQSNERLEFLGDAVLEVTVSDYLFEKYPDKTEGELTKLRASIVCEPTLALCSRQIKLGEWILLSKGEEHTGGRNRDSITSDAMEAVIGAIYRDGGFEPAQDYIRRFILEDIDNKKLFYDSKTILQELLQKDSGFEPEYEITGESGPDHDKHFTAVVKCDGTVIGDGEGHTKKAAQQAAAYNAILKMRQNRK